VSALAADPEHFAEVFDEWRIATDAARGFVRERTGALVGRSLMSRFDWKVGDLVMLHGLNAPIDIQLKVVGASNTAAVSFVIVFRHDYLDEALGHRGTADIFWVKVDRSQNILQVIRDIDETFANAAFETKSESELAASENKIAQMRS
jgi:putative ABC transport system permease protein